MKKNPKKQTYQKKPSAKKNEPKGFLQALLLTANAHTGEIQSQEYPLNTKQAGTFRNTKGFSKT